MAKVKEIKITEELFCLLAEYFLLDKRDADTENRIIGGVNAKWEALYKRQLYAASHDPNLSAEEQERARQKYLDMVGMHSDFRWDANFEQARKGGGSDGETQ